MTESLLGKEPSDGLQRPIKEEGTNQGIGDAERERPLSQLDRLQRDYDDLVVDRDSARNQLADTEARERPKGTASIYYQEEDTFACRNSVGRPRNASS